MKRSQIQAEALDLALGHLQHMSAWVTAQQKGYSFESLGEDMGQIRMASELTNPQRTFHKQREDDDCLRACLATVLKLPYEYVPHFVRDSGPVWYEAMLEWLHPQGLHMMRFQGHYPHNGIYLVDGWAPRGDTHIVIFEGLEMIWDPHADAEGIIGVRNSYWLLPLDASDVLT